MEFHPLVELFPVMDDESLGGLASDIKQNGLHEPIWLFEGRIVDGRNRYLACQKAGVEPTYREWSGDGVAALVQSLNIHRRHLTSSQRATIALELLPRLRAEAKERQRTHKDGDVYLSTKTHQGKSHDGQAVKVAAQLVGVGRTSVVEAGRLAERAPALLEEVRAGRKTIGHAAQQLGRTGRGGRLTSHDPEHGRWKCPVCLGKGWVNKDPGYTPFEA